MSHEPLSQPGGSLGEPGYTPRRGPIETKVTAATMAAAVAGLVLWVLETYVFDGSVPEAVGAVVALAVPAVLTFLAGYQAKHTPRRDLAARGR